jgi:nucleoid-associated protein YgaU
MRQYVIRPGDTLIRIASRELGDISLANNIFLLNRDVISDPDRLQIGDALRLPSRESLRRSPEAAAGGGPRAVSPVSGAPADGRVHVVVRGDTLSSLALRYYGSSASWRAIFEANRRTVPNPDRLDVGMELAIPPQAE